jgi:hypothetical protein
MINATKSLRDYALKRLSKVDQKKLDHFPKLRPFVDEVVNTLEAKFIDEQEAKAFRKQLFKWNYSLDKNRGINITNYIPYSNLIYG